MDMDAISQINRQPVRYKPVFASTTEKKKYFKEKDLKDSAKVLGTLAVMGTIVAVVLGLKNKTNLPAEITNAVSNSASTTSIAPVVNATQTASNSKLLNGKNVIYPKYTVK